jgi:hypothetical protein
VGVLISENGAKLMKERVSSPFRDAPRVERKLISGADTEIESVDE